jgi:hypothetical protein
MFKKTLQTAAIASLLCAAGVAQANDYYVVVPVPNRTATSGNLLVSLSGYSLPSGLIGHAYSSFDFNSVLQVSGDPNYTPANVRWSLSGGALPTGLSLSADGKLSGTPTAAGNASFQLTATYKTKSGQQAYQVFVADINVALASASLPDGTQNVAYTYDFKPLVSVSGDSTFTPSEASWSLSSGTLPAGLQLNSDGTLSGVPTKGGAASFTVTATYSTKAGTQTYSVTIAAAVNVAIADASLTAAYQGYSYSYNLKNLVTVTTDNYSASQLAVSLTGAPTGLSFDTSTGVLSGNATQQGSYPLTLTATYGSKTAQKTYTLAVTAYKSCADYLAKNPGAPSGTYLLDVDGSGPVSSMNYSCDMTSDGGGWTRIVRQTDTNPVTNWNGGVNGMSYAVATQFIPAHTQVAFGKDETATALDYVNWTYSTGDIAVTTVTSPKTGRAYQVHRSAVSYYNAHDPENPLNTGATASGYWTNTLTFDRTGINPAYTWAFSPLAYTSGLSNLYGGYSFNGTNTTNTLVSYAWTVWVR